VKNCTTRFRN